MGPKIALSLGVDVTDLDPHQPGVSVGVMELVGKLVQIGREAGAIVTIPVGLRRRLPGPFQAVLPDDKGAPAGRQLAAVTRRGKQEILLLRTVEAVQECKGDTHRAAILLGVTRTTVYQRLQRAHVLGVGSGPAEPAPPPRVDTRLAAMRARLVPVLEETVRCWRECGENAVEAAKRLHVRRNTVRERLIRAHQLGLLDPGPPPPDTGRTEEATP